MLTADLAERARAVARAARDELVDALEAQRVAVELVEEHGVEQRAADLRR